MAPFLAEVAPAAPLLPPLTALVGFAVALGLVYVAHQFIEALFKTGVSLVGETIGRIPWIGGKVTGALHRVEQRVNNYMAKVVSGLEAGVAESWHNLAVAAEYTGRAILATAQAVWRVGWYVEVKFPLKVISALAHQGVRGAKDLWRQIQRAQIQVTRVVRVIEHPFAGPIAAGVKAGTKAIVGELGRLEHWIGTQGRWIGHEVAVELPHDIAGLRARDISLSRLYSRLRKLVARHEKLLGTTALVGAVAYALSRLGAGWVRCTNWNRIGRTICSTPYGDIEGLLALFAAGAVIADLRQLVKLAQTVEHGVAVGIKDITGA